MKVFARASAGTAIAMLVLGASVCWGQLQPQQTMQYPQTQAITPTARNQALADAQLQEKVQNQLDADPALKATGVSATVTAGKVQLMGIVPEHSLKAQAGALARSVPGARGVQNLISIGPAAAAEPANPAANPASAAVPAGTTASSAAESPAHSAYESPYGPNARSVQAPNGLENGAQGNALQNRVAKALAANPALSRYPIIVTVNANNDVILRGVVPSKMDRRQAQNLAKAMAGVHQVENKLQVNPSAAAATSRNAPASASAHAPGPPLASQSTSGAASPVIMPPAPPAASANPAAATGAAQMAASVQRQVREALRQDPVLRTYRLTGVLGPAGLVTLKGTVPSRADRNYAKMLVQGIAGVRVVHIHLQIDPNASLASPHKDPPPAGMADPPSQQATTPVKLGSPQDVRTELQARLQGNPDFSGVVVYVNGHTVTLRGNVASKAAQRQAAHVVKSALPKNYKVHNHVAINHGMGNGFPPLW